MNSYSSDEHFQIIKNQIINIVSNYTRDLLFRKEHYSGPFYPYINYEVDNVKLLETKGFNHFIFEITFTIKDWGTITSLVYVENGVIYNSHRK